MRFRHGAEKRTPKFPISMRYSTTMFLVVCTLWICGATHAQAPAEDKTPAEIRITQHMVFSKGPKGFLVKIEIPGPVAVKTDSGNPVEQNGVESWNRTTSEEGDFVARSFPPDYRPARIRVHNEVDPDDIHDVEHTPRYELYLDSNRLRGHVWLRPRGGVFGGAHGTDLHIQVTMMLIRSDRYEEALKSGKAVEFQPGATIYSRWVSTCNRLHIQNLPIVEVDDSTKPNGVPPCGPLGTSHHSHHVRHHAE